MSKLRKIQHAMNLNKTREINDGRIITHRPMNPLLRHSKNETTASEVIRK